MKNKTQKPKDPVYTLRLSDIQRIKLDAAREVRGEVLKLLLGLPCMALRDSFDFNSAQLETFIDSVLNKYDSFERGYITIRDVDTMLLDECGITLRDLAPVKNNRIF